MPALTLSTTGQLSENRCQKIDVTYKQNFTETHRHMNIFSMIKTHVHYIHPTEPLMTFRFNEPMMLCKVHGTRM